MRCPRVEVDLSKIRHNTRTIVGRLKARGIGTTGVTKAVCGHPDIAKAMLDGGARGLADSRLGNVQRLRKAGITCPITLIRTPMLSQVNHVVRACEASYNTEMGVITALADAARQRNKVHGIILMVEMGDMRDGIMPQDLSEIARQVGTMPGVVLKGIGTNFACLSGCLPDRAKMQSLSLLADSIEAQSGRPLQVVSGGNSANLPWALGGHPIGRTNDLRLGEALFLGVDPASGDQIGGLFKDAFTLVAEIIETDQKPAHRPPTFSDPALARLRLLPDTENGKRVILAVGQQDTDVLGLSMPPGHTVVGASSDHLVLGIDHAKPRVGSEMRFPMNYSALMRAMAAPDVQKKMHRGQNAHQPRSTQNPNTHLALT